MFIRELELNNFQKHSHLKLEFTDKVNILYGESDAGKSCIIRAIKWIFFNQGKDVRKEETKKTSVKVTLDNNVTVEKIKSNTVNAYILYKDGEEKRFDSIGKTIPEEIKNALQVRTVEVDKNSINLNVADQITLPFLIGESATFRSKLFNKLTGNDITDKVFQSLNKDILQINRETKLEEEHLKEQEVQLKETEIEKDKIDETYEIFYDKYERLKTLYERYEKIKIYAEELNNINSNLEDTNKKLKDIKSIPEKVLTDLNEEAIKLDKLLDLNNKIISIKEKIKITKEKLANANIPEVDIDILKEKCKELERLRDLYSRILDIERIEVESDCDIDRYSDLIKSNEEKYKKILKEIRICPFYEKKCPLNKEVKS